MKITLSAMVDYQKVFDALDYSIMLNKMHKLISVKNSLKLIMDYISYTYQFVQVDDKQSVF